MHAIENADRSSRNRVISCHDSHKERSSAKFENELRIGTKGGEERRGEFYSSTINSFLNTANKVKQQRVQIIAESTLL